MEILLLSGGSGKRLWPLSNQIRSKQFLKLLQTDNDQYESMLQRICRQLDSIGLLPSTHIITCNNQLDMIHNQIINKIPIICEPIQRGTFSAISLAVAYLHSIRKINPDKLVCVLPVDSFTDHSFFQVLKTVPHFLHQSKADLALIGVEPIYPSNQFGYIVPKITADSDYYPITRFIEKPNRRKARSLIKKNALWNCGVYVFPLRFMLQYLENHNLPSEYDVILKNYHELPNRSFDCEVAEQSRLSIVIPFDGMWRDVGNWDDLSKQIGSCIIGPGEKSNDSINTHIVNELSQPIYVIGISNSVIAAGPDGILIANKKRSSEVKQFIKDVVPRYVEKRWGSYKVLEKTKTEEGKETITKIVKLLQNRNISYQQHQERQEIWSIISGIGEAIVNGQLQSIKAGDVLQIPAGTKHSVRAITPLEFIEVQLGSNVFEEDIVRITYSWEEALQHCK